LLVALGGAAAVWPLVARAQTGEAVDDRDPGRGHAFDDEPMGRGFPAATARFWVGRGSQHRIEYRWAEGRSERYAEIAAEFVRLKVDVIVRHSTPPVVAAKQATSVIPIRVRECKRSGCSAARRWRGRSRRAQQAGMPVIGYMSGYLALLLCGG
jgi:putative ABC transport system substrate-binding protein